MELTTDLRACDLMAMPAQKKDWIITQEALDGMLAWLDASRDHAGQKYEKIRQKLMKFFKWRGCTSSEEYADRTIDVVARRIAEGADLRVGDPYLYFHGVALKVLKEHWREPEREQEAFDGLSAARRPFENPLETRERELERLEKEEKLDCLDECVERLPPETVDLIARYHDAKGLSKDRRRELAESLNIPLNALRIRAYRIRVGLESCIDNCLGRPAL